MTKLYKTTIAGMLCILLFASCKKHEYYQENPNSPSTATPSLLLTNILVSTFSGVSLSSSYAVRHLTTYGASNVNVNYNWTRSGFGTYVTLRQVYDMDSKAAATGEENYRALAKFFKAYHYASLTETFGDIPYTDAMKAGEGVISPKYDSQKDVYIAILKELEEANSMLDATKGRIDGDIIFGSKPVPVTQWKKLINAFRLRLLIHLSKKEGDVTLNIKQQFADIVSNPTKYPLMETNADNAQIVYNTSATSNWYPTYQSVDLQTLISMEKGYVNILKDRNDPRLFSFAEPVSGQPEGVFTSYAGVDAGLSVSDQQSSSGKASRIKARYFNNQVNEPSILLSYSEQELLIAEGIARGWATGPGTAKEHYDKGVTASMAFYGITGTSATTYLAQPTVVFNATNAVSLIAYQKYIGFFMNSGWEPFMEQRRTGVPTFGVGPATANGGKVPSRWMYPESELTYNDVNLKAALQSQFGGTDDINQTMWLLK